MSVSARALGAIAAALLMVACAHAAKAPAPTAAAPSKKRGPAPPPPAGVSAAGVHYTAITNGTARGLDQPTGYIAATDAKTGRELWTLKIYPTRTDPEMEQDKQDLYIAKLALADNRRALLVTDERGGRYMVDLASRRVQRLP